MLRPITLACALVVAIGAGMFAYQMLPDPVPEPTVELHRPEAEGPPPKLEVVGSRTHQFGSMVLGGKDAHTWEFRNVGRGPLEVWVEETTCSCTVASLKPRVEAETTKGRRPLKGDKSERITIAPGESAPLVVDWEARRPGKFAQAATLGTTDPADPSVVLSIIGNVVPSVEVRPSDSIAFPDGSPEEARRESVEILSIDRPDLKLTKIATSRPDDIVARAEPMPAEEVKRLHVQSGYRLIVEIRPGMPTGRFSEEILIETDHPRQPSFKVALTGQTLGPIGVVPSRVGMPSVPSRAGGTQKLDLIVRDGRRTDFRVVSKSDKLRVDVTPEEKLKAGGRYRLTVTVPPGTPPGLVDDPIVLRTDHPKVKELRIPVSIYVSTRSEGG